MLQEFKNSNTHAMMSELAGLCREQLALNNDAVKHQRAHMHQRVTSSGEAAVAMVTVSLSALSSVAAPVTVFFSFHLLLLPPSRAKQAPDTRMTLICCFSFFRRMPAGTCSVAYNTHLAQTHSFVINSCLHL